MNNGLWIQDHAHASTKPLFHPDSLHYGASTWAKTCNNWFLCHVPEFPLKPTNLYHAARWKIAALCLMLECVSILAGILVVSGPSKLEFGDVWGKDIICKVYIYICVCVNYWIIMCICIAYILCTLCLFFDLQQMFLLQVVEMRLWHDGGGCQFLGVGSNWCAATARAFFSWMDNFPCMTSYGILWHYGWFNDAFQGQRHQIQYTCVLKWMGKACEDSNVHVAKKTQPGAWWVNWWNSFPDNLPSFALVPRKSTACSRATGQYHQDLWRWLCSFSWFLSPL